MIDQTTSILLGSAVGAGLVTSGTAICLKGAEQRKCSASGFAMAQFSLATALSLCVAFAQNASWSGRPFWVLGVMAGVVTYITIPIIIKANGVCPPSLVWVMVNMGLLVPVILSTALLGEPFRPSSVVMLIAFAGMLFAFHRGTQKVGNNGFKGLKKVGILAIVLLVSGLQMFTMKLNEMLFPGVPSGRFSALMFGVATVIAVLCSAMRLNRNELRWGGAAGLSCGASMLLLLPAMALPTVMAFPVIQGSSLLGGGFLTAMVFKERMNIWKIIGVCFGLAVIGIAIIE